MKQDWCALAFAMLFPTAAAWAYFVALPQAGTRTDKSGPPLAVAAAYVVSKVVQFAFPLLYVWVLARRSSRPGSQERAAFAPPMEPVPAQGRARGLVAGLAFGLFVSGVVFGLYVLLRVLPFFQATPATVRDKVVAMGIDSLAAFILFGIFLCVAHSFLEEYYWRWFVFGRLKRLISVGSALVLSSLAFMAHHVITLAVFFPGRFWPVVVPLSACVAVGGGMWAWLYHRSGSIYSPWLSHALIDAAIMAVGFDMAFGNRTVGGSASG